MNDKPPTGVLIRDWTGMVTNADPRDIPDSCSQIQVNMTQERAGEIITRGGLRPVSFDDL